MSLSGSSSRHLEPKRELIVSVDPTLTALNKATLDKPFEKTLTTRDIAPSVGFASRGSLLPGNVVAGPDPPSSAVHQIPSCLTSYGIPTD